jgi:hypothetical protein
VTRYVANNTAPSTNTAISATETQPMNNCHANDADNMATPRNEQQKSERKAAGTHQRESKIERLLTIEI